MFCKETGFTHSQSEVFMQKYSRQHKSSVFCLLFDDPDKLRSLYNALTGSSYNENTPVVINTLRNKLSLGLQNDISFTIGGKTIVLLEHQSTINPNMPARLLIYMAALFENLIPRSDLYSRKIIKIPQPEFYLFYNGSSPFPDRRLLKLSDSFESASGNTPSLEIVVQAYNINTGHNESLLNMNRDLGDYARFVDVVRSKKDDKDQEEAYRLAIKECIDNNILREFLENYREDVMRSLLDISREEYIEIRLNEAREEVKEESRREKLQSARKLKALGLSAAQIAESLDLPLHAVEDL